MSIVHLKEPRQASGSFSALTVATGQKQPAGLTLIGEGSYGDWTLYAVRQKAPTPAAVPNIVNLTVQVGHQSIAVNANILPNVFLTAQSLQTWIVYHAVCSELRCDIVVEEIAGAKPQNDRVVAWIAPGRPSSLQIPQRMLSNQLNLIPTFATSLELYHNVLSTDVIEWYSAEGVPMHTTQLTTSAGAIPVQAKVPVVSGATHALFVNMAPRLIWNVLA